MEKLLELLNEYEKSQLNEFEEYEEWWYCKWNGKIFKGNWENNNELTPYELYSKQFGFIKWLVENDKIDIKKLIIKGEMRSGWDFDNKKGDEETGEEIWNKYYSELCLMLLSISDTPIEDLISYLHE